jgi:aryl-alcohol dehydrogenase-like predicted oxidoreductase
VELGGTLIDTAAIYGHGESERVIGEWLRSSRARESITLLTKGAHPDAQWASRLDPASIIGDLDESLARLGVDDVDVLLVHRDDESLPVEPIIDTLQTLVATGRTRAIGVSNWTTARLDRAIAYAASTGGAQIAVSSVYLGLAAAEQPMVPGCVDACDAESLAWYAATGLPLLAWAAQSVGYFNESWNTGSLPDFVVDTYDSPGNRERRARAQQLAQQIGATPNQVALAWVLAQGCRPIALAGAREVEGIRDAMAAANIHLSDADRDWLATGVASA